MLTSFILFNSILAKPFSFISEQGTCVDSEHSDRLKCTSDYNCSWDGTYISSFIDLESCCKATWLGAEYDSCIANFAKDCAAYTSKGAGLLNSECKKMCEDKNPDLESKCEYVQIGMYNGNTHVEDGSCYNKWIYGYSDEGEDGKDHGIASMGIGPDGLATIYTTQSAFECQELCQKDDMCVNWVYRAVEAKGEVEHKKGDCILKSASHVNSALNIDTSTDDDIKDVQWCNVRMGYACNHIYECLECQAKACVWKSDNHFAGPKYCAKEDICKEKPIDFTTTTPKPTTTKITTTTTPKPTTTKITTTTTPKPTTTKITTTTTHITTKRTNTTKDVTITSTTTESTTGECVKRDCRCGCKHRGCKRNCCDSICNDDDDVLIEIIGKPKYMKIEIDNDGNILKESRSSEYDANNNEHSKEIHESKDDSQ